MRNKKSLVSIIITTKNSGRTLEKLLKSIKLQSYKRIETIVIDNKSSDKTFLIAKKYTKNVFDYGPERSSQRNFGIKKAKGDYLLILDSDMILTKNIVLECVNKIEKDKKIGGVIIPERSFGEGIWSKAKILEREINEGESYFEAARFFPKELVLKLKGYDENITGPEDWDLPNRIAKKNKIERIESYILHDEGKHSLLGLVKKKYYYGLSADKYLKKQNISAFGPRTIYILRPAFYRNWNKILDDPIVGGSMILMLLAETVGGGLGYLIGKYKNEE